MNSGMNLWFAVRRPSCLLDCKPVVRVAVSLIEPDLTYGETFYLPSKVVFGGVAAGFIILFKYFKKE